jgi:hypothetical protein
MPTSAEREEPSDLTASISREPLGPTTLTRPVPPAGMTTVEYLILLVLIAAVSVGIWKTFGETDADAPRGEAPRGDQARHSGRSGRDWDDQAGTGAADSMPRSIA